LLFCKLFSRKDTWINYVDIWFKIRKLIVYLHLNLSLIIIMGQVTGIKIERNIKGFPIFAHVDLRKNQEVYNYFIEKGVITIPDIPNKVTRKAISQAKNGIGLKKFKSTDELFKHWDNEL